ncbi:MAG: hypothetical protein O7H41_16015 [Planctomycetota bacterium]|nr:hypothetical protein [Planctomycetota bacterium]
MSDDKPRKSRSDAELVQTSENHLKYEVDMLAALTEAIPKLGPEEDESFTSWGIRHALLESFAVHARTLLGFLYSSSPWEDDVIAEDFFDDPETWRKARPDKSAVLSKIHRRVGKEIVHLTYARSRVTKEVKKWPILEIYQEIATAFRRFLDLAPKSRLGSSLRKTVSQPDQGETGLEARQWTTPISSWKDQRTDSSSSGWTGPNPGIYS